MSKTLGKRHTTSQWKKDKNKIFMLLLKNLTKNKPLQNCLYFRQKSLKQYPKNQIIFSTKIRQKINEKPRCGLPS